MPIARTALALTSLAVIATTLAPRVACANPPNHPRSLQPGVLPPAYDTLTCTTCHVTIGGGGDCPNWPCFNPFGYQYWSHDRGWAAIATLDADADGRTNVEEVVALGTLPAFPEAALGVGCDMSACATSGSQDCGSGVRCESAFAVHGAATSHYAFWFSCGPGRVGTLALDAADWSGACVDANECAASPCGTGTCAQTAITSWSLPGYTCTCGAGEGFDGATCVSAGECTDGSAGCAPSTHCVDPSPALGDARCVCPPGTSGDGRASGTGCVDVDECAASPCANGICHALALDAWSAPGLLCECGAGYAWDGSSCKLDDECLAQLADCVVAATCSDPTPGVGDFACTCQDALVGDGRWSGSGCGSPHDAAVPDDAAMLDAHADDAGARDTGTFDATRDDAGAQDAELLVDVGPPSSAPSCACRVVARRSPTAFVWLVWALSSTLIALAKRAARPVVRRLAQRGALTCRWSR